MLEGVHYQNAYVTRDIDKWVDVFQQNAKVDRVIRYEGETTVTTPDGPATQTSKIAFLWIGDLQYEIIQPMGGTVRLYSDALPADDGLKFHHTCLRVPDWESFRARVDQEPYPVAIEGGSVVRFLYIDARPFLGHFVEYAWIPQAAWTQMGGPPMPGFA